MKPLRWQTNAEETAYMKMRQSENRIRCARNPNENWMRDKLKATPFKWTRQPTWGYRIFDFFSQVLGVAIEVDGPEHDAGYDAYRDEYNFRRSGLVVIRVRNRNEQDAAFALAAIAVIDTWKERRAKMGLDRSVTTKKGRRRWVNGDPSRRYHAEITRNLLALVSGKTTELVLPKLADTSNDLY